MLINHKSMYDKRKLNSVQFLSLKVLKINGYLYKDKLSTK